MGFVAIAEMGTRTPVAANVTKFVISPSVLLLAIEPNGKERFRKPNGMREGIIPFALFFRANSQGGKGFNGLPKDFYL